MAGKRVRPRSGPAGRSDETDETGRSDGPGAAPPGGAVGTAPRSRSGRAIKQKLYGGEPVDLTDGHGAGGSAQPGTDGPGGLQKRQKVVSSEPASDDVYQDTTTRARKPTRAEREAAAEAERVKEQARQEKRAVEARLTELDHERVGTRRLRVARRTDVLPRGAVVRLHPAVQLAGDGTVANIAVSPLQRTPSPFGSRMGDHTVAWSAVVDALHADLQGRPFDEAVQRLGDRQGEAGSWMGAPGSLTMEVFLSLEERDRRVLGPRLEDAAAQVTEYLTATRASLTGNPPDVARATRSFELAVAQHLAFLNYLPCATVRAAAARGSTGSNEGGSRNVLLAAEAGTDEFRAWAPERQRTECNEALWGMFSFEAAIREAEVELVLTGPAAVEATYETLSKQRAELIDYLDHSGSDSGLTQTLNAERAERIRAATQAIIDRPSEYVEFSDAARDLQAALRLPDDLATRQGTRKGKDDHAASVRLGIEKRLAAARELRDGVRARAAAAPARCSQVLAELLHEHQATVVPTYQQATRTGEFLGTDAAAAAVDRLRAEIMRRPEYRNLATAQPVRLDRLLTDTHRLHAGLGAVRIPDRRSTWYVNARAQTLVVRYDPGTGALVVNGRPPAPWGVAGMGSHTTAWITETEAVEAVIRDAVARSGPAAAVPALHRKVADDLGSAVMALDVLLPTDQITGGQLTDIFDAAVEARKATTVAEAAAAYLTFRNVLPFATVDQGDRIGHNERSGQAGPGTLDRESLEAAAVAQQVALADPRRRVEAVGVLNDQATALDKALEESSGWKADLVVAAAVRACAGRLRAQVDALTTGPPSGVAARIVDVRAAEHDRVVREIPADRRAADVPNTNGPGAAPGAGRRADPDTMVQDDTEEEKVPAAGPADRGEDA